MIATFCFGPSGTWSPFHAGVATYVLKHIPFDRSRASAYVISGGALGLTLLLYDDPSVLYKKMVESCEIMAELKTLGILAPFHTARICRKGLEHVLPDDAHIRLGDRVLTGLTHFPSLRAVAKQGPFKTKDELLDALLASAFIPGFFFRRFIPGYYGYIDGGFSHAYVSAPIDSIVVTVARYPVSDISADSSQIHLNFLDVAGYMKVFWHGYECARESHSLIITKLMAAGLM